MSADALIDSIVEEVLRRLERRVKKATVVFTGGAGGFPEALEQVKLLLENGWNLKIVLSRSAEYVLTPQHIRKKLGIEEIYLESENKGLRQFYEGISVLVIPTLTFNTAAKISLGICDSLTTNLASHVIMTGIPIVAASDACDLRAPVRKELGMDKAPEAYYEMADAHLENLKRYGITLVEAKKLFQAVEEKVFAVAGKEKGTAADKPATVQFFKKKVLTRADIVQAKHNGTNLQISHTTILSPLALETAEELGVKIIRE